MTAGRWARCEIWWAAPTGHHAAWSVLDPAERCRCRRLQRAEDRERCVTARALLRHLLAGRTGVEPDDVVLDSRCVRCGRAHGKPRLLHPLSPVAFNAAHAGRRVVVAITDGSPVGVDIEQVVMGDTALAHLSTEVLAPAELAAYRSLSGPGRRHAMGVWWTRKESVLKAVGTGLTVPPSDIVVTDPTRTPEVLEAPAGWPDVHLRDLDLGEGHVGCVAVLEAREVVVSEHQADRLLRAV
jgi:4'-phosphopantetheinyl transferase